MYVYIAIVLFSLLILYFIYTFVFMKAAVIPKSVDLNTVTTYSVSKLSIPNATTYFYEALIWIDDNIQNTSNNILFRRDKLFAIVLKKSELICSTNLGSATFDEGILGGAEIKNTSITSAFPFQKWVHFVMNVDGSTIDFYLDGRLILSKPNLQIGADSTSDIIVGNKFTQGKIKSLIFEPSSIDPAGVYSRSVNNYITTSIAKLNNRYNVNMDMTKDNVTVGSLHIM